MLTVALSLPPKFLALAHSSLIPRTVAKLDVLLPEVSCFCGCWLPSVLPPWFQGMLRSCSPSSTLCLPLFLGWHTALSFPRAGSLCGFLPCVHHYDHDHHFPLLVRQSDLVSFVLTPLYIAHGLSLAHIIVLPIGWLAATFHDSFLKDVSGIRAKVLKSKHVRK